MKILSRFLLSMWILNIPLTFAGNEEACAVMNKPGFQKEYQACLNPTAPYSKPIPHVVVLSEKSTCEGLKNTSDVYSLYSFGQQLGLVKEENFNDVIYKNITSVVNKTIDTKCGTINAENLIKEAHTTCLSSCDGQASLAGKNKLDAKKIEILASTCKVMCKLDNLTKNKFLDGVAVGKSKTDCMSPNVESVSNLIKGKNNIEFEKGKPPPPPVLKAK